MKSTLIRFAQYLAIAALALGVTLWVAAQPVHALPEYAARTGESCATCHVSPGGGGPRTLRGLLWAARWPALAMRSARPSGTVGRWVGRAFQVSSGW